MHKTNHNGFVFLKFEKTDLNISDPVKEISINRAQCAVLQENVLYLLLHVFTCILNFTLHCIVL